MAIVYFLFAAHCLASMDKWIQFCKIKVKLWNQLQTGHNFPSDNNTNTEGHRAHEVGKLELSILLGRMVPLWLVYLLGSMKISQRQDKLASLKRIQMIGLMLSVEQSKQRKWIDLFSM